MIYNVVYKLEKLNTYVKNHLKDKENDEHYEKGEHK